MHTAHSKLIKWVRNIEVENKVPRDKSSVGAAPYSLGKSQGHGVCGANRTNKTKNCITCRLQLWNKLLYCFLTWEMVLSTFRNVPY